MVKKYLPPNAGGVGFNPWAEKISWRSKWQPTPVSLPGKSHGQRTLAGYSPGGCKRAGHCLVTKQQQHRKRISEPKKEMNGDPCIVSLEE